MPKKRKKIRTDFRKNRAPKTRRRDWTRRFAEGSEEAEDTLHVERISGKDEMSRQRTVVGEVIPDDLESPLAVQPDVDREACRRGLVLAVHGRLSDVQDDHGNVYRCVIRRLLKTLSTSERGVVVAGDRVLFQPIEGSSENEGVIESVEPRRNTISRESKGRRHVLASNLDQILIVAAAAQPRLKPELIDRMLVTAAQSNIEAVICINKVDLVDPADLQPLIGSYGRQGYRTLLLSARTGYGIEHLIDLLRNQTSVVAGQSGVGKSSLINAIDPDLHLAVREVSRETEKGRHTTTVARLHPLKFGGYICDTPGIRQFQPWDLIPEEVVNYFRDLRPWINRCRFPNCTHIHEADCAVKDAVADGRIDERRYEAYCHLFRGDPIAEK
ncbi:ribosome small subunit-dependent GTPase A [Thermostilla marina]